MADVKECEAIARRIRLNIIRLAYQAGRKGAHIAPSLSMAEIMAVLYHHEFKKEDSFILSKGHGALCWYCAMHEAGLLTQDQLDRFEENGGPLPGQPSRNIDFGIEFSSGSLGMGMSYAAGLAWGANQQGSDRNIYVLLGDGEMNEGSSWEGMMFASQHKLNNIMAIVDRNGMQSDGFTTDIMAVDLEAMWKSFGWNVIVCNGHDVSDLIKGFSLKRSERPNVIIANTIKGKGIAFMENAREWHHNHLSKEQYSQAILELGGEMIEV